MIDRFAASLCRPSLVLPLLAVFATGAAYAESAPMRAGAPALPAAQHPSPAPQPGAAPAAPAASMSGGKVLETMNASSYTYVRVKTDSGEKWAAGPQTAVEVGDEVHWAGGTEMKGFASKSLNRSFDSIWFVDRLLVGDAAPAATPGAAAGAASPHGNMGAAHGGVAGKDAELPEVTGIKKADGGLTVAEIYEKKDELDGKDVTLRGKVVKYNSGVMGRNWLHLRDGSHAASGENDLTVTSDATAAVGDVVVVTGKLVRDKDFGFGYRYDVMLEGASVKRE